MTQGCRIVSGVAAATKAAGVGGIATGRAGGLGHHGAIAVSGGCQGLRIRIAAGLTGIGLYTCRVTSGSSGDHRGVLVTQGCRFVSLVGITTGLTGVSGVTLLGTGGGSHLGAVAVIASGDGFGVLMSAITTSIGLDAGSSTGGSGGHLGSVAVIAAIFQDLQISVLAAHRIATVTHIVKHQILAVKPVGSGIQIGSTAVGIVHRTDLRTVHIEIDHVGAIGGNLVAQPIGMLRSAVNAVIIQINATVGMTGSVIGTQEEQVRVVAEQEGGKGISATLSSRKEEDAGGLTLRLPFDAPFPIVHQLHRLTQPEASLVISGAGNTAVIDHGGILGVAGT